MRPLFFEIGGLTISAYTALVDLGIIFGLLVTSLLARWRKADLWGMVDAALVVLVCGVIGSRLAYVALQWPYFSSHLRESFYLWRGGLAFQGAFLGGVVGLLGYSFWYRWSFWRLADLLVPGLALGQAIGWVGCLLSGCAYGLPARGTWAYELPDLYGITVFRFPTQAVMSGVSLLIFMLLILLLWRTPRPFPGLIALLYLLLYSLGGFVLEFTRGDETLYLGPLRWSQIVEAGEFLGALILLRYLWRRRQQQRERPPLS
jgi:phosphatidylglycerol:prolipoprotein diacylglycerol transferase